MLTRTTTEDRAVEELRGRCLRAPSRTANASRNAQAEVGRRRRWAPARDALWSFLAPALAEGARVAIVGAGNGDDLPLRRIADRAGAVTLIDIDPGAAREARLRLGRQERRRVSVLGHDVTGGAADRIALAALRGEPGPPAAATPTTALPGAPYDLAIGDLLYSQLLYPALVDLGVGAPRRAAALERHAAPLTGALVTRLHASAARVVHLHDPLAWWDGHPQPVGLADVLAVAATDPEAALALAARGRGPHASDPRGAPAPRGSAPTATALWRWPFSSGVDYLVCATLAAPSLSGPSDGRRARFRCSRWSRLRTSP